MPDRLLALLRAATLAWHGFGLLFAQAMVTFYDGLARLMERGLGGIQAVILGILTLIDRAVGWMWDACFPGWEPHPLILLPWFWSLALIAIWLIERIMLLIA